MNIYYKLRELLDTHSAGCPEAPEIIEILKLLFTEAEAKVALGLGFSPFTVDVIARRARTEPEETRVHLESMADKGLVFTIDRKGQRLYGIVPTMPGLYEFPVMRPEPLDCQDELVALWQKYLPRLSKYMGSPSMPISRVIPIEEEVRDDRGVLPSEKVYELIDQAGAVGIAKCACRIYGNNCDAPLEACMVFDDICEYLVSRGIARRISKEEMKDFLRSFDEQGLVHQMNNSQDKIDIVCNCCPCCCALLKCLNTYDNPYAVNSSGFIPKYRAESCTGCGICADERCPMKAITLEEGLPEINSTLCIGCGLCVTGCPEDALKLVRREDARLPAPTGRDIGMTILKERGRTEEIKPYLDPKADPLSGKD